MIGPGRVEPGRAPGGLVCHTYSPAGQLLVEHCIGPGLDDGPSLEQMEADAVAARAAAGPGHDWILVVFDGDTGDRWGPRELEAFAAHLAELHPCPITSAMTGVGCSLPYGHPPYSPSRFHRFQAPAAARLYA